MDWSEHMSVPMDPESALAASVNAYKASQDAVREAADAAHEDLQAAPPAQLPPLEPLPPAA